MSQFLDAAYPQSAAKFLGALAAAKAAGFTFYIGGDIALAPWDKAIVDAVRAQYPGMAIHVPDLDSGDGAEAVALAKHYELPAGYKIALDIEPGIFRSKAGGGMAAIYADQWCDAVRAAGYVPVLYGTVATCVACADHADFIWLTVPGQPDPNAVGLAAAFFAGRRAIQYAAVDLNGVQCDVSNSQYSLAGLAGDASHHLEETMTPQMTEAFLRLAYEEIRPGELSPAELTTRMARAAKTSYADADVLAQVVEILDSPEATAYHGKLSALVAHGIQPGPKGDKGDPGQDGAPGKDAPQLPAPPAGAISWLQAILDFFKPKAAA